MRILCALAAALFFAPPAASHLVRPLHPHAKQATQHKIAVKNYRHAMYVCVRGTGHIRRDHCRAIPWLRTVMRNTEPVPDWVAKQIRVAEQIGHAARVDPWPNCPDPIWNGASSWRERGKRSSSCRSRLIRRRGTAFI